MKRWIFPIFLFIWFIFIFTGEAGLLGDFYSSKIFIPILIMVAFITSMFLMFSAWRLFKIRKPDFKTYPPTTPIPERFQELHLELQSLGFVLCGEVQTSDNQISWHYFNEDHSLIAHLDTGGVAGFSSYFSDGLDVTTVYPSGVHLDTEKLIIRIVESSLSQALDFHLHHIEQHRAHGEFKIFTDLIALRDWETQHNYADIFYAQFRRLAWNSAISSGALLIVIVGMGAFLIIGKALEIILVVLLISAISMTVFQKLHSAKISMETVESRKKRKPKEVETAAVAQEEIYPF